MHQPPLRKVHTATLITTSDKDNLSKNKHTKVVIKVLRPDIYKTILADVKVMSRIASIVARWLPDGKRLRPVEVVAEYKKNNSRRIRSQP